MEERWINYKQFVAEHAKQGYEILEESNGLSWVRMFKIDEHSQNVELVYWGRESGVRRMTLGFKEFYLLYERLEHH